MELQQVEERYFSGKTKEIMNLPVEAIDDRPYTALYKLMVLITAGKLEEAKAWKELLDRFEQNNDRLIRMVHFVVIADFLLKIRDLTGAMSWINEGLKYYQGLQNSNEDHLRFYGRLIRLEGVAQVYQGNFIEATEKFSMAIDINDRTDDIHAIARGYFNRAASLYWLGDIDSALVDGLKGYELIKEQTNTENFLGATNNIGLIYFSKNEPEKALKFFMMSLQTSTNLGNMAYIALNYHNIIRAYNLMNNRDKTAEYLEKFEKLDKNNPLVKLLYSVSKGMVLLKSSRIQEIAEGQRLLDEVISADVIDHQFTILAIFTALDYLLLELEKFEGEEILTEINDRLTKLDEIANNKAVRPAMVQGTLIRSRLLLIQGDVEAAKTRLKYGLELAEELGQESLAKIIEDELNNINENFEIWARYGSSVPLVERIKSANLLSLVKNIKNNQLISKFEAREDPLFFIILRTSGMPIFTRKFDSKRAKEVNEFLISGFLTAVDLFGRETFEDDEKRYVDKLQFKENEIILRRTDDIVFSYAYKGSSRSTTRRFDNLVTFLSNSTNLLKYIGDTSRLMPINEIPDDLTDDINAALDEILINQELPLTEVQ